MSDGHLFSHEESILPPFIYNSIGKEYESSFSIIRIVSSIGSYTKLCKSISHNNLQKGNTNRPGIGLPNRLQLEWDVRQMNGVRLLGTWKNKGANIQRKHMFCRYASLGTCLSLIDVLDMKANIIPEKGNKATNCLVAEDITLHQVPFVMWHMACTGRFPSGGEFWRRRQRWHSICDLSVQAGPLHGVLYLPNIKI